MNAVMEKELVGYCRRIRQPVPGSSKEKTAILHGLRVGLEEYVERYPEASLADIRAHFGEPSEIAKAYLPEITPEELRRFSRRKQIILWLAAALAAVTVLFAVIYSLIITESPGVLRETGVQDETLYSAMQK